MISPQTPKGFRDYLPSAALARSFVLEKIIKIFRLYGFDPLETPAIEFAETLKGKYGEEEKLIYEFEDRGGRQIALRYDQTVPLARVVAQYPEIPKPFKRYQIQNAWRAENVQKGRSREFLQIDFDIVGVSSASADAEIAQLIYSVLSELGFKEFKILINSRTLLNDLVKNSGVEDVLVGGAIASIDKLKKIGDTGVVEEMVGRGTPRETAQKVLESFKSAEPNQEIKNLFDNLKSLNSDTESFVFEPTLARGLNYYTGIIFEAEIVGSDIGSVCGGGRYDKLMETFSGVDLPAVGASFGMERLLEAMTDQNLLPARKTSTEALVTVFSPDLLSKSLEVATLLREAGINAEVYLESEAKLDKQLKYADNKGIPYAIIIGPDEAAKGVAKLKNLASKEQSEVPISDLPSKFPK